MKADTRANEHNMRCEGRDDFKAYRREHAVKSMPNDVAPVTVVELPESVESVAPVAERVVAAPEAPQASCKNVYRDSLEKF